MSVITTRPAIHRFGDPARAGGDTAPGDTAAVVLVHGTMDRCASFRKVAQALPDRVVVGWDRRGWGSSAALGDSATTLDDHVDDLCAIARQFDRPVVAGHSYGGLVALVAAARQPDLVRAVVAFEPPVRWLPWWPVEAPWEAAARSARGPAAAAEALLRAVLGDAGWARLHHSSREKMLESGPALLTEMNDPRQDVPAFDPVELTVPIVAAAGADTLPHHLEVSRRIAALAPRGEFVLIDDTGHSAHLERPDAFAGLVRRADDAARRS